MSTNDRQLTAEEKIDKEFFHVAPLAEAMSRRWTICLPGRKVHPVSGEIIYHNDTCIVTEGDWLEVVGSSEWISAKQEILEHIVRLHNFYVEATSKEKQ
jgi:hypothetical protein